MQGNRNDTNGVALPEGGTQYQINDGFDLRHLLHLVHACEKRLRECDAADKQNFYPQNPYDDGASLTGRLLADQWEPSPEELATFAGKQALIADTRYAATVKRNRALAMLRQATHPSLLNDDIFKDFDLDKAWAARPPPPEVTRQPGMFIPAPVECVRGPPAGAGRVAPPKPDKVELMNAHYAEQQSLLLAHPRAQPGPYAA